MNIYYDSLFKGKITESVKKLSFVTLKREKKVKVHFMPVQQQKKKTDCGICSIALAYFIANNTEPSIVCLEDSVFIFFSKLQNCTASISIKKEQTNKEKNV